MLLLCKDEHFKKYRKLNEMLVEVIQDYSLVTFTPLDIQVTSNCYINLDIIIGMNEVCGDKLSPIWLTTS